MPASLRAGLPASTTIVDVKSGQSDVSHLPVEAGTKITWNFKVCQSLLQQMRCVHSANR